MRRTKRSVRSAAVHCKVAAGAAWSRRCVALQSLSVGVGRPSAGGRRTKASPEALSQHRRGLSVLRRPSRHWLALEEQSTLAPCRTPSLREAKLEHNSRMPGVRAVTPKKFGSLALRSTAAPGRWFGAGTGFARAGGVGALGCQGNACTGCPRTDGAGACALGHEHEYTSAGREECAFSTQRPNPSVERTSNGGAHWRAPSRSVAPLAAAHLKRWAATHHTPYRINRCYNALYKWL
jgi:hypothetical protein